MSSANGGRTATMSDLIRSSGAGTGDGSRPRIFLVRQNARSVRPGDARSPLPVRLAIGVIVGAGTIILAWLIGTIGLRLGFAPLIHVPGLDVSVVDGLTATVLIAMSVPATIIRTGVEHPMLMMLCYALIALPAGCLAGARTATPGGPRPHPLSIIFAYTVAVLSAAQACALVWWAVSSFRTALISPLPVHTVEVAEWFTSIRAAAGLDMLACIIAALWVVLIMRVAIPLWLRALCAPAALIALVVVSIAMSMTNTTVSQMQAPRMITGHEMNEGGSLIIGRVDGQRVVLSRAGEELVIELHAPPAASRITGRESILTFTASD